MLVEFSAGLGGLGWRTAKSVCATNAKAKAAKAKHDRRFSMFSAGLAAVGGCTAKSGCATKSKA